MSLIRIIIICIILYNIFPISIFILNLLIGLQEEVLEPLFRTRIKPILKRITRKTHEHRT